MEKLDLQVFRELREEMIELFTKYNEAEEISEEEEKKILARYAEIIKTLSEHDLSDIGFEEWEGMYLGSIDSNPLNFSKTNANIDFSIIEYEASTFPNFKGCQIKNFDFEKYNYSPDMFDEEFIKANSEFFLSEEVSENVRTNYYCHTLTLKEFSENLQYFEGKKVLQSFKKVLLYSSIDDISSRESKIIKLYGEGIYQLFADYKPIIDKILNDYNAMQTIEIPTGPITDEQRKERMTSAIMTYIIRNGYEQVQGWDEFKMILDFVPAENLPARLNTKVLIEKYGIDKIIESGLDMKYLYQGENLTSVEEIASINGIELDDIKEFVDKKNVKILNNYDAKQLLEYGIKDLLELSEPVNNLQQIKEMLEKRPWDLINLGTFEDSKKMFIEKYGIDNIIALDEETGGMFSHPMWQNDIYLTLFAHAEGRAPKLDEDKKLTYEEFENRMYEILLHSRDERGVLCSKDYPDYDFIQGKFREEHQDIFIDGNIPEQVKREFYTGHMKAETVRQNRELIELLQGKDLSRVFAKKMRAGLAAVSENKEGMVIGIPNMVNMAQYLSKKLGQEEFLKICADYGKCLDNIGISTKNEITVESLRETIEQSIYKEIKEKGLEYFEDLPLGFQEKHPELFLPKEIDEDIRKRFCEGNLSFEDIRKNPQIKQILLAKDVSVGFGKIKYGDEMLGSSKKERYVYPMWKKLSEQEIMDLAETYGDYLRDACYDIVLDAPTKQERISELEYIIEASILREIMSPASGRVKLKHSPFNENVPKFFKDKHPNMFLDSNAPEELKECYYDGGTITFELIKEHPEWREFLQGKDISRAFSNDYIELFKRLDSNALLKLGARNPETIVKMVQNHREETLDNWYKSTGGKFVPHHVVMLNFPESEIDSFLGNSKRWSQLMKIDNYNLNDDGKAAILKAAYAMGVFQGDDDGFNKTMKLFTDIPQELSQEEYEKVEEMFEMFGPNGEWLGKKSYDENDIKSFKSAYTRSDNGKYVFNMDKQKNKNTVKFIRDILENSGIDRILTPIKAHQMFDSFAMTYNSDFARFLNDNLEEIISTPEYITDIATIQRQFKDIVRTNAGRRLTLEVAENYIKSIAYTDIEIGNEGVAEQAKIAGYSQKDFEAIQSLFNEGEIRDYSSIPRIQGKTNGYSYEMLRCDDPLALTIGTLTNCCQEIHGAGQTSMEHSVVSPDGRVFCVRDSEGRLVAQSWFWRNQYTGCFDNIEIPDRIFTLYEKEHPDGGRKELTSNLLEVYKKAAQDLMQEDSRVYHELLENGTITQEQYNALLLGKVTIGLGYNDIADAIVADMTIHKETDNVGVKGTDRLPHPYTDAKTQFTIAEREGTVKSEHENLYVHQDDIPVYDATNISNTVLLTMKRMEQSTQRDNLAYIKFNSDKENSQKSQIIINSIAREYGFDPNDTRVIATARMALIYSKDENKITIGDLLSSPIKEGLTEEQKQKATAHIMYQIKKALKQIGIQDSEVDLSSLDEEQQQLLQSVMQEIEKENDERGER